MMSGRLRTIAGLVAVTCALTSAIASAADWGGLKGRFVVDGTPPKPAALVVTKDQFCIDHKPTNEALIVGDDHGLANTVVFLRLSLGQKVDIHPDFAASFDEPVVVDNHMCHFVPHVTLARTNQTITLKNSDPVGHNTNLGSFNQIIPAGGEVPTKLQRAEVTPKNVTCNIHPFMKAYILVQDHPYMAVSDEHGKFEINNIPAGTRRFSFWHEAAGFMKSMKIGTGATDRRGTVEVTIKPGETLDIGDIKVPVALLKTNL
jgi:hypothetical protein